MSLFFCLNISTNCLILYIGDDEHYYQYIARLWCNWPVDHCASIPVSFTLELLEFTGRVSPYATLRLLLSVLYCTVLYCTVLYCTVLHRTALYRTVHYSIGAYSSFVFDRLQNLLV